MLRRLLVLGILAYIAYEDLPVSDYGTSSLSFQALGLAIQTAEGWFPGSRSYRNNNPGNLRYAGQAGATGADDSGFAIFDSYDDGFAALINQLQLDASRNPNWTLQDFVNNYAPPSDNNNDTTYLNNILSNLPGASATSILGSFA